MTALDLFRLWLRARLLSRQRHWVCDCGADNEGPRCGCGRER